ncbi:MAG: tRNA preQ1(34) S-adenosylmethionine ribosyltransferase-isomerase QueA [Pseudomonadota bacterium]
MHLDDFDFDLPADRIALRPADPRDSARMLVVDPQAVPVLEDRHVTDLAGLLRAGDVLVVNNTRVIPAALTGTRRRGDASARISVNLLERLGPDTWTALARPLKRLAAGDVIVFGEGANALQAESRIPETRDRLVLVFDRQGTALDEALDEVGAMPLPPYIAGKRPADSADDNDYQTLFARHSGAVAAPTAGLHFTDRLLNDLKDRGIETVELTLHVGAGTFLPVKTERVEDHVMHAETGEITPESAARLNRARAEGGRIVAVGTTCLRLLESAARADGTIAAFSGSTDIFIKPGHRFRGVDALMTNFHLPRSTLFMLVCAFSGTACMQAAYRHAVQEEYRFFSYGDASLLFPEASGP